LETTHPHPPAPGEVLEVAKGVRWARMPLPFALDHVNVWLLEDGEGWTAVDTGLAWEPTRAAWEAILAGHPLRRLVVTHLHPDHLGLAAWLQHRTAAPVWMTQAEYATAHLWLHEVAGFGPEALYASLRTHGLEGPRIEALERRGNTYRAGAPELPATFRPIFDGERLAIGPGHWRVLSGHGHSPDHASLHGEEARVLISGDMLLPRITTNISAYVVAPEADTLGLYLASLDRLEALPEDLLVLPSHGLPFRGLRKRIGQLRAHHDHRCGLLRAACATGPRSAASLLPVLFERDIADPFQTLFAMGECIAHLTHLEHGGALVRTRENGVFRFAARAGHTG